MEHEADVLPFVFSVPEAFSWRGASAWCGACIAVDAIEVEVLEAGECEAQQGAIEDEDCED